MGIETITSLFGKIKRERLILRQASENSFPQRVGSNRPAGNEGIGCLFRLT